MAPGRQGSPGTEAEMYRVFHVSDPDSPGWERPRVGHCLIWHDALHDREETRQSHLRETRRGVCGEIYAVFVYRTRGTGRLCQPGCGRRRIALQRGPDLCVCGELVHSALQRPVTH